MKKIFTLLSFMLFVTGAMAQALTQPPSGGNQKSKLTQWMGPVEISIAYSSPDVHDPNGKDRKEIGRAHV